MSVRDLARIGMVMLRGGKVGDLTIVPSDFGDASRRAGHQR
jgi:hypothetical protein